MSEVTPVPKECQECADGIAGTCEYDCNPSDCMRDDAVDAAISSGEAQIHG